MTISQDGGPGLDAGARLPRTVRPWALFPPSRSSRRCGAVQLLSYRRVTLPLGRVEGLEALVEDLPSGKQALALAWCEAEGAASVDAIVHAGATHAFLGGLVLSAEHEQLVERRLHALERRAVE